MKKEARASDMFNILIKYSLILLWSGYGKYYIFYVFE